MQMKALKLTEFVSKRNWNFTSQKKQLLDNARPYVSKKIIIFNFTKLNAHSLKF